MAEGFARDEYLQRLIQYTVERDDWSAFLADDGRYYGNRRGAHIFVPLGTRLRWESYGYLSWYEPAMFHWAYTNAELFRWSLVDESIPLKDNRDYVHGFFDGCRRTNAIALCELRYWPALPELRETMLHDLDRELRTNCVEAIGAMGQRGVAYAADIRESVRKYDQDSYYLGYAVRSLKNLMDKEAVPLLRELYEQVRERIDRLSFEEAMKQESGSMLLIDDIMSALIKLDPDSALEVLAMELTLPNPHVCHFAERAFILTRFRRLMKLMDRSLSAALCFLPGDQSWMNRRRGRVIR